MAGRERSRPVLFRGDNFIEPPPRARLPNLMRLVTAITTMQQMALRWRRAGLRVALVPTMGYLHAGHLSLVRRARALVGPDGVVVVSVYVNPTQFLPTEDMARYPRNPAHDRALCKKAGVDTLFFPSDRQMYPGRDRGQYSSYVMEERLSRGMEGAARPGHFRGVATVVAKLFNIVLPHAAVFGAKDWQQAAVIDRMTTDLNFPVKIVVAPTKREADGLALSSRNAYLSVQERRQATVLSEAIGWARAAVRARPVSAARLRVQVAQRIARVPSARLDYVQFFDPKTVEPLRMARRGAQMALAVFIGNTRLIDNGRL
jgi:pantoate--beta-alanine ligase